MGGILTRPVTTKHCNHGEGLGLRYGLSSMQGWRPEMEDAHNLQVGLDYGLHDWSFFAVFDGHAGKHTSSFASCHLLDHILADKEFKLSQDSIMKVIEPSHDTNRESEDQIIMSNEKSFQCRKDEDEQDTIPKNVTLNSTPEQHLSQPNDNLDARFESYPIKEQVRMVQRAIKSGFLKIDQTLRADKKDMSGSTAICAFISPTHLFIANCGDSRAVLYDGSSGRTPKFASIDHKPLNPNERRRIIKAGGRATERVNGTLAVSRSLGDFGFKRNDHYGPCDQLVSPEPEITAIEREPADQFLILACDGIWDVLSNEELCQYVEYNLRIESNLETVCSNVIDVCLHKGSRDNMSIIIVVFEHGPKLDPVLIEKVKKDDEFLVEVFKKCIKEEKLSGFSESIDCLEETLCKIKPDYRLRLYNMDPECGFVPPGVGIIAKYDLLREIYDQYIPQSPTTETELEQEKKQ